MRNAIFNAHHYAGMGHVEHMKKYDISVGKPERKMFLARLK
jgi:hypothetical protein